MFKFIASAIVAVSLPAMANAITYNISGAEFETENRQSVWGAGDAAELSGTKFIGAEWDEEFTVDALAGSDGYENLPNPAYAGYLIEYGFYETKLGAYNLCKVLNIGCGSRPSAPSYVSPTVSVYVDTRTGARADVETTGKVGFDLNYQLDAGSFDASVIYDIEALLPELGTIVAGEGFSLGTSSQFTDGEIDTQSPTANASIDAVLKANVTATGIGCVILFGCSEGTVTLIDIDEDREIIGIDPNQITFLDGFTPEGVELKTSLLNQSVTLQVNVATIPPKPSIAANGIPQDPAGIYIDLAQLEFTVPQFTEVGGKEGDDLTVSARSDFIDLTVDLDTLFSGTGILPPGGASASVGPLSISMDAYDFDAGPSFDVYQDLKLTPTLMVSLDFSKPVEILGQLRDTFVGAWDALPDFKIFDRTVFSPTFFVSAILESVTGIQAGLELTIEFLKASLSIGAFNVALLELNLGPLVSETFAYDPDFAKFALYDKTFDLSVGAFSTYRGDDFVLTPGPIPLPAALPMLLAALAGMGWLRTRRRIAV